MGLAGAAFLDAVPAGRVFLATRAGFRVVGLVPVRLAFVGARTAFFAFAIDTSSPDGPFRPYHPRGG